MNLSNHFLISMPHMVDDTFRDSLVYILDHGENGAFGVIVNKQLGMSLGGVFSQLSIESVDPAISQLDVLRGGPVDEQHGLVLHRSGPQFEITRQFADGIALSSSRDVLEAIANAEPPMESVVLLGHSGWAPGQLELEIINNAWLTCQASADILFTTPLDERRQAVANQLGVDLEKVVAQSGRA